MKIGKAISENIKNNDIVVYIRKMILKYGKDSLKRMEKININIDLEEFNNINSQLESLEIPKDICISNPYWDPLILNKFYKYNNWEIIPKKPFDSNFVSSFEKNLSNIKEIAPYYYNKYFGEYNNKFIKSLLIYSNDWCKEEYLIKILTEAIKRNPSNLNNIDEILGNIINKISFSIPKLLKPILDIQDPTNPILSFIEMGAYFPITRRLIEFGIPRETSIKINNLLLKEYGSIINKQNIDDKILLTLLKKCYECLDYWERIQIENII